jgi:3-oxoacyl-[acyl-carrier-protein] synthase III
MSPDSNLSTEEKSSGRVCDGVAITGWAAALGARLVLSEEVDRAFGMPIGKLRSRAGIESVSYAAEGETELTLGAQAMQQALSVAGCQAKEIDWIIASSETHVEYPSLAAQLHKRASVREKCGVLDAGGACLGLLNAVAVAQSFLESGRARNVAVVTADVHSRTLVPGRVAGEFGGLFGDGASAFILRNNREAENRTRTAWGNFCLGARINTRKQFAWLAMRRAVWRYDSMGRHCRARRLPAWSACWPKWKKQAEFLVRTSGHSRRTSQIHGWSHC